MSTRDKLEYQKNLRFIREASENKAKLGSPALKLAKIKQDSDLTKPVLTLGDKHNKIAQHKEPKYANEVPKTRETSRVAEPVEAGDEGDNCLDVNLDDIDYARISEGMFSGRDNENTECSPSCLGCKNCDPDMSYGGPSLGGRDIEGCICDPVNCRHDICNKNCVPCKKHDNEECSFDSSCPKCSAIEEEDNGDEYEGRGRYDESRLREATSRQKNAKQSLARHKRSLKDKRTKSMKHKSNVDIKTESVRRNNFLNELSSLNKEMLPGSGNISKQMKEFDELLQEFAEKALELHEEFTDEMTVDILGGQASPQMSPRIGERNRMLMVRAGILRKLAAACTSGIEAARREG